jgi:hypothetical protein
MSAAVNAILKILICKEQKPLLLTSLQHVTIYRDLNYCDLGAPIDDAASHGQNSLSRTPPCYIVSIA